MHTEPRNTGHNVRTQNQGTQGIMYAHRTEEHRAQCTCMYIVHRT